MSPAAHQAWPDREKQAIGRHKVRATRSDERCPARLPAVLRFLDALATKHRGYCDGHNHRDHGRFRNRAKFSKSLMRNVILAV